MTCSFEFRSYQRPFRHSLQTHHGQWSVRTGIILKLTNAAGQSGLGEIAPLPWFGSENTETALTYCQQLSGTVEEHQIQKIPHLPACQWGFESALEDLKLQESTIFQTDQKHDLLPIQLESFKQSSSEQKLSISNQFFQDQKFQDNEFQSHEFQDEAVPRSHLCALLPPGAAALTAWQSLWQQGYRTFKLKIGVAPIAEEQAWVQRLASTLPPTAQIRLDANGGLTFETAADWLQLCDRTGIQFLEQPLSPEQFAAMQELAKRYKTPLALDESVATLAQLQACYRQGWRGIFVVKAAIAGSPSRLRQFCRSHAVKLVFSTVFETVIGRRAALRLGAELNHPDLAMGFGVGHWFEDDWDRLTPAQLWQRLG